MKKFLNYTKCILVLVLTIIVASCGNSSKNSAITHIPVQLKVDGNWSFLDIETGAILFEGEFKKMPSVVTEGVFKTQNEEGEFFYNKIEDEKVFKQIAGPFKSASLMNQGLAIVCKAESHLSAINAQGEDVFTLEPQDGIVIKQAGQCIDGLIKFEDENHLWGFLDKKGKIAIKPQFDYVDDFHNGLARATMHSKAKDKFVIINKSGEVESEIDKGLVGHLGNGIVAYSDNKKEFGVLKIGKELEKKISASSKFEIISVQNDDIFYASENSWGLLNEDGEIVIRAKYEFLSRLDGETFLGIKKDGKDVEYEILNAKGEVVKKDEIDSRNYGAFNLHSNGRVMLKDGKEFQLIDAKGENVGNNPVKEYSGVNDIVRIESNISYLVESDYFDWAKIDEMIESIKSGSLYGFTVGMNCVKSNDLLVKFASSNSSATTTAIHDQGRGLVFTNKIVDWDDLNGTIGIYIGVGYDEKNDETSEEESESVVQDSSGYVDTSSEMAGNAVDPDNGTTPTEIPIKDNAPEWETYQTTLSESMNLGHGSSIGLVLSFDDYIKKALTKPTVVDYGYTTMVEEKVIGYERNSAAKLTIVQMEFAVQSDKIKKLKTKLEEKFSKGFQLVSTNYGSKYYVDAKGAKWELNGLQIRLFQPYSEAASAASAYK
jgi:hypothetical protein